MSDKESNSRIDELIELASFITDQNAGTIKFTTMQLRSLVTTSLVLQERIWKLFGFKFQTTFVLFALTHELEVSEALALSRKLLNSRDEDELFVGFYYMLQEMYVASLEEGDE